MEKDYLQRICKAAQRMGQIIDDLLQLSRINRVNFNPQQVSLSNLVKTNFDKLRETAPSRHIEIEIEPDVEVRGDASLLDIALQNLVNNSWKYTSKKDYGEEDGMLEAAKEKIDEGFDYVLFGHLHERCFIDYNKGHYINLGWWVDSPCYGAFKNNKFEIVDWT